MNRFEFLGSQLNACSMQDSIAYIDRKIAAGDFVQHAVVNVAKLVTMRKDEALRRSVNQCDLINIDGMGVVWGARAMGHSVPERVTGIDLFVALLQLSEEKSYPVYLLGAEAPIIERAVQNLRARFPALPVAGYHHGYFWDDEEAMVEKIRQSGAKLLFVAITSPKKENFIDRWHDRLGVNFVMGVGGTFDVVAGKVSRAPLWVQKLGMEWFYRLCQEPRRMWKRYLVTNTQYLFLLFREKIRMARAGIKYADRV